VRGLSNSFCTSSATHTLEPMFGRIAAEWPILSRSAMVATVVGGNAYIYWVLRVDIPMAKRHAEAAKVRAQELEQLGAVVLPPHGLETEEHWIGFVRGWNQRAVKAGWRELRWQLQRFWRANADDSIDIDRADSWPDPEALQSNWKRRHAYTLRGPASALHPLAVDAAHPWTRVDGAPQLVLAAYMDPSLRSVHFGDDTHRFLRYAVDPLWYWIPWLGPPKASTGLYSRPQGWRIPLWPFKSDQSEQVRSPLLGSSRNNAFHLVGPLGQHPPPSEDIDPSERVQTARTAAEWLRSEECTPEERIRWHCAAATASLVTVDSPQQSSSPLALWPGSHRVVRAALASAAASSHVVTERSLSAALAQWAPSVPHVVPPLEQGSRVLLLGDTVRAFVTQPPSTSSQDTPAPVVVHVTDSWFSYASPLTGHPEPSREDTEAMWRGLSQVAPALTDEKERTLADDLLRALRV
jgi:hypothetical protein